MLGNGACCRRASMTSSPTPGPLTATWTGTCAGACSTCPFCHRCRASRRYVIYGHRLHIFQFILHPPQCPFTTRVAGSVDLLGDLASIAVNITRGEDMPDAEYESALQDLMQKLVGACGCSFRTLFDKQIVYHMFSRRSWTTPRTPGVPVWQ